MSWSLTAVNVKWIPVAQKAWPRPQEKSKNQRMENQQQRQHVVSLRKVALDFALLMCGEVMFFCLQHIFLGDPLICAIVQLI